MLNHFAYCLLEEMNTQKSLGCDYTDFTIIEGLRSKRQQLINIKRGVSKTKNSLHLLGLAIDIAPYHKGEIIWDDSNDRWDILIKLGNHVIFNNPYLNEIQNGYTMWGWDKPHWQITNLRNHYNAKKVLRKKLL